MKFGTPDDLSILDTLNLKLPLDHPENSSRKKAGNPMKIFTGCSVWGDYAWIGDLFPEKTKKKDYLSEYIRRFNSVELNSTFYNIKKSNMLAWADKAKGTEFKFCPKFNRRISHIKRLKEEIFELTDYFVEMCLAFGDNLGCTLLQMPENFGPKWFERLKIFLAHLPKDFPVAVELRHAEWYQGAVFDELFAMLAEFNKTAVITDSALKREIIHQRLIGDTVFVRFAGYVDHASNRSRLDEWIVRLVQWQQLGISEVYFFCKHEDESYSPRTVSYLVDAVNNTVGTQLIRPYSFA